MSHDEPAPVTKETLAARRAHNAGPELLAALKAACEAVDGLEVQIHAEWCSPDHGWRDGHPDDPDNLELKAWEALIKRVEEG